MNSEENKKSQDSINKSFAGYLKSACIFILITATVIGNIFFGMMTFISATKEKILVFPLIGLVLITTIMPVYYSKNRKLTSVLAFILASLIIIAASKDFVVSTFDSFFDDIAYWMN